MFNICWLDIFSPAVLSAKHHILFSCDFRFTLHLVGNELVFVSTFQTFFGKIRLVLIPSSYATVLDFCLFSSSLDLHYLLWGSVRGGWGGMSLGRWGQMPALSEPAALSLSPCCPVSRCWPEEAPAQWTPQREGELGGAQQGVPCRSTSSTGQYRSAWAPPRLLSPIIPSILMTKRKMHLHTD